MTTSTPTVRANRLTLTTDFLLTRLSVAFSRRRHYPPSHPLVRTADKQVQDALAATLAERGRLTLIVGRAELFVDDDATPLATGVARELSERLRQRGIGSLAFDRATAAESLIAAIAWLASEPEVVDGVESEPPILAGVTMARFAYGRLALGTEQWSDSQTGAAIWQVLASIALVDGEGGLEDGVLISEPGDVDLSRERNDAGPHGDGESTGASSTRGHGSTKGGPSADGASTKAAGSDERPDGEHGDDASTGDGGSDVRPDFLGSPIQLGDADPSVVAAGMEQRLARDGYARRVAFVLLRVADQVAHAPGPERAALGERLRAVLGALRTSSLGVIIKSVGVGSDQRRFMSQVIEALPVGAIVQWLESAAQATGHDLSNPLLRLLAKLSKRTQGAAGSPGVEGTFRDAARGLAQGWIPDGPMRSEALAVLDRLNRFETSGATRVLPDAGAVRVLQISLEVDRFGEDARDAAQQLLDEGRLQELLQWIADAPGATAAAALKTYISSPAAIKATLLREPLDQVAARTLLATLDENACDVLLEVLCDAEGRTTRRLIYDRLREFGSALAPRLSQRLEGAPWYFVRNLLALMRDTANVDGSAAEIAGATLFRFLSHEQEQVRVEALRLLLEDPAARGLAIRQALGDPSERVLRLALTNLGTNEGQAHLSVVTPDVEQRLLRLIDAGAHAEDLLARAVSALVDASPSMLVRDRLLAITTRRTLVLRRMVLADVQPIVIAALDVLARRYAKDAKVVTALKLASVHPDSRMRDAVKPHTQRTRAA